MFLLCFIEDLLIRSKYLLSITNTRFLAALDGVTLLIERHEAFIP